MTRSILDATHTHLPARGRVVGRPDAARLAPPPAPSAPPPSSAKTDVAFTATTEGVFLHDGSTTTAIAMSGDPTPLGGTYSNLGRPVTRRRWPGGVLLHHQQRHGGWRHLRPLAGVTTSLVARGDPAPGGGTFGSIVSGIAMSPNGFWVAFIADTSLDPSEAVWVADTIFGGIIGPLLTEGAPSPCGGSVGTLGNQVPTLAINDAADMAVYARGGTDAILRGDLFGPWSAVACEGQPTPLGGTYRTLRRNVRIGNNPTATVAYLSTVTLPGPDPEAVFARSSGGAFVVAAEGDLTTGGQTIDAFRSTAVADVTAASDVIFTARTDPGNRDAVLVRSITAAQATALLLKGDACPAGGVVGVLDTWVDVDAATGAAAVRAACTGGNGILAIPARGTCRAWSRSRPTPPRPGRASTYDDPSRQGPHSAFLGNRTAVYRVHCDDAACDAPTVVAQPLVPVPGLPGETIATIDGELVTGQGNLVAFAATTQGTALLGGIFAVRTGALELVCAGGTTLPGTSTVIEPHRPPQRPPSRRTWLPTRTTSPSSPTSPT